MNFTETKPTVPGAYWWRKQTGYPVLLVNLERGKDGGLWCIISTHIRRLRNYGEWSSRLVPVDEVEKAYSEGRKDCWESERKEPWEDSRARRVVEGREAV